MAYTTQTRLDSKPQGGWTREAVEDEARKRGAKRMPDLRRYLDTVYGQDFLNPEILAIQSAHETGWWTSYWWEQRLNPAGISITGDPAQNNASKTWTNGRDAARAHLTHVWLYARGTTLPDGFPGSKAEDPRWDAAVAAGYAGTKPTIGSLTNTWAIDSAYDAKLVAILNQRPGTTAPDDGGNEQEAPMAEQKRFVIAMGHRNTDRGGAYNEINWTPGCARAIRDAIEARGGKAVIVQEHDSDNDPNWFPGGLQAMARHAVTLAGQYGPFEAYISCHYNGGAGPGFHAIFPDAWSGIDQKANNPLDVRLCENLVAAVRSTNTVSILGWTSHAPGVMSERESGVGAQGYRLGELYGGMGFRDRTARVIIEAGSIDVARERAYINDPHWLRNVYAEAIAEGLEATFGKLGTKPTEPPVDDDEYVIHIGDTIRTTVNLRLRQGPHLNAPTVIVLPVGTEAVVNGAWSQADGYGWLPVETAHGSGFVATAGTDGPYVELVKRADPPEAPEPEPDYVAAKPIPALLDTNLDKYDTAQGITTDAREQDFIFISDVIEFTEETVAGEYAVKNPRKVKANYQPGDRAVAAWLVKSQDTNSWWYVLTGAGDEWIRVPFESTKRVSDAPTLMEDVDDALNATETQDAA